jgi:hypothetical protein
MENDSKSNTNMIYCNCKLIAKYYCFKCKLFFCVLHYDQIHSILRSLNVEHPFRELTSENERYHCTDYAKISGLFTCQTYFSLRTQTCEFLFENLMKLRKILIKSPPSSGKTILGILFKIYVQAKYPDFKVYFIFPFVEDILTQINITTGRNFTSFSEFPEKIIFIFDETQLQYQNEKFWKIVDDYYLAHNNNAKDIYFLFLALYTDFKNIIPIEFNPQQSFSFDLLRLTKEEYNEIIVNYNSQPLSTKILYINKDISELIERESDRHPALINFMIDYLHESLESRKMVCNISNIQYLLFSRQFYTIQPPERLLRDESILNPNEILILENMLENDKELEVRKDTKLYYEAKSLEKKGFLYEIFKEDKIIFSFTCVFLKRRFYKLFFASKYIVEYNISESSLLQLSTVAVKLMRKSRLLEIFEHCSNEQDAASLEKELYHSLDAMIGYRHFTLSKFKLNFIGKINLYIHSDFKWAIQICKNGERLKEICMKFERGYKEAHLSDYIIIDFRSKEFKMSNEFNNFNILNVIYNQDLSKVDLYYKEKPYELGYVLQEKDNFIRLKDFFY